MKFYFIAQKTALHIAVEKGNVKIVKLLLANKELNINYESILFLFFIKLRKIFC